MHEAIALVTHPANKDASTHAVVDVKIGRSTGTVFKAENGFVPAFRDMAPAGFLPDAESAVDWIRDYAGIAHPTLNHAAQGIVRGANLQAAE